MKEVKEIDIILVTFNRLNFLKEAVKRINERTKYPHRLIIVDNASTDGTQEWLKGARLQGLLNEHIFLEENKGFAVGINAGFELVRSEYFITTQDDLLPPDMTPCWLERLLHLKEKHEDYVGISMRIQRIRHRDVDEHKDIIDSKPSLASVFRITSKEDIEAIDGFGERPHWESTSFARRTAKLKKKLGVATHLYADHTGFMPDNKGFGDAKDFHTYAENRITQGKDQPYPEIDSKSQVPLEVNTERDRKELLKKQEYYDYWGHDDRKGTLRLVKEQEELSEYCNGKGLDLGCGKIKCHPDAIGMDVYPHDCVDILGEVDDLWFLKDNELDFIVNSHLLEHLKDPITALKEWHRVLKPGGILAIAVPNGERYPKFILKNGHKSNFGMEQLRLIFKFKLGMKVINLKLVKNSKGTDRVILIVGKKR